MWSCFLQVFQTLPDTKASHSNTLRQHQCVLIKERYLQVSASDIQNRRSLLNRFFEAGFNSCNGFISEKMLFCITQDLHPYTCSLIYLFQNDRRILKLAERTCCTRTPAFHPKVCHHAFKIIQNLAQLVHSLHLQTSCCICSPSQLQLVTDIINFPEADSPGHFKYLHADFIGSYINCRKGCHSHSSSSFPPTRVDYFFFSSSVPTI